MVDTPQSRSSASATPSPASNPQEKSSSPLASITNTSVPGLGLALGGGVARGWAHIGVLRRLDELGIRPATICGTSVGALVAGFWLAGHLDDLEAWTRSLNKRRLLSYLDVMLNGAGLIGGKRLEKTLHRYLPDMAIEDLPLPCVVVTTELATGHEIWLRQGNLAEAIQAAYALPGIFPPRMIDGRWLMDGALVNPLPVSVCRALNARIVIGVGLHAGAFQAQAKAKREKYASTDDLSKTEPAPRIPGGFARNAVFARLAARPSVATPGLGEVMFSSFNILMDRTTRSRLAADPADVLITPDVSHVPLIAFEEADALIALGRKSVDDSLEAIEQAIEMLA
ncbi:MAG: patatin-like phospholipase family protein [Pseudomonadota bacterium]